MSNKLNGEHIEQIKTPFGESQAIFKIESKMVVFYSFRVMVRKDIQGQRLT